MTGESWAKSVLWFCFADVIWGPLGGEATWWGLYERKTEGPVEGRLGVHKHKFLEPFLSGVLMLPQKGPQLLVCVAVSRFFWLRGNEELHPWVTHVCPEGTSAANAKVRWAGHNPPLCLFVFSCFCRLLRGERLGNIIYKRTEPWTKVLQAYLAWLRGCWFDWYLICVLPLWQSVKSRSERRKERFWF